MTPSKPSRFGRSLALAALGLAWLGAGPAAPQESVQVVLPAAVSFTVFDVSVPAAGSPDPTRLEFTAIDLQAGNALRVSVQAEAANFTPPAPGGSPIPASRISWTTSGAQGGAGTSGTLSDSAYGQVFQSSTAASSAQVDVHWTLAAVGGGVRAGWHDLTLRWKLESVVP
jgi:hypothetical protein